MPWPDPAALHEVVQGTEGSERCSRTRSSPTNRRGRKCRGHVSAVARLLASRGARVAADIFAARLNEVVGGLNGGAGSHLALELRPDGCRRRPGFSSPRSHRPWAG